MNKNCLLKYIFYILYTHIIIYKKLTKKSQNLRIISLTDTTVFEISIHNLGYFISVVINCSVV